ncbi:RHS repeat-associated core domain-containing protein, partial [Marinobacterium iners]
HTDHLNTPQVVSDNQGTVVWRADYDAFGQASIAPGSILTFNLRFPGQYFDSETGLHYNYYRDYDPSTGRYLQSDPIGLRGGLNTYVYVNSNPVMYIDPLGLTALQYDQSSGTLTVDPQNGSSPYNIPSSSGRNGSTDQTARNQGPIPTGGYTGNASNLTNPGFFGDLARNTRGDWGDWRMPLNPNDGTNTFGRDGFFLHGGSGDGSAGCIDIGGGITGNDQTDRLLNDILNDPDGIIPLTVIP